MAGNDIFLYAPLAAPNDIKLRIGLDDTSPDTLTAADSDSNITTFVGDPSDILTADDAPSAVGTYPATQSEAGTAADSQDGPANFTTGFNISESGAASDAPSAVATYPATASESGTASDSPSNTTVFVASDSESASATDAPNGPTNYVNGIAISENGSASDSANGPTDYRNGITITESGSASEACSGIGTYPGSHSESGSASDTPSAIATFPASNSESGTASESVVGATDFVNGIAISETATAADSVSGAGTYPGTNSDSLSAADNNTATVTLATDSSNDSLGASDSNTAVGTYPGSNSETLSATDAVSDIATFAASVSESGSASDSTDGAANYLLSVAENGNASDLTDGADVDTVTQTDSITPSDSESCVGTYPGTLSESASAADAPDASVDYNNISRSDTLTASDAVSAGKDWATDQADDTLSASDARSVAADFAGTVAESSSLTDAADGPTNYSTTTVVDILSANAAQSGGGATDADQAEAGTAAEDTSTIASFPASLSESSDPLDTPDASKDIADGFVDNLSPVTIAAAQTDFASSVSDGLSAADSSDADVFGQDDAAYSDSLNATDSSDASVAYAAETVDGLSAADLIEVAADILVAISEIAAISDIQNVPFFSGNYTDSLTAQDATWASLLSEPVIPIGEQIMLPELAGFGQMALGQSTPTPDRVSTVVAQGLLTRRSKVDGLLEPAS